MALHVPDRKMLWGLAAAKCSKCQCDLFLEEEGNTNIGEESHISSHSPDIPSKSFSRYIHSLSDVERDKKYDNAILLCAKCHKVVDNPKNTKYTIEKLHQIKVEHEAWVAKKLAEDTDESWELKKRVNEIQRKIEIYKIEFTLNKERHAWIKSELTELENTVERADGVDIEAERGRIYMSGTARNLENSLERYGMDSPGVISCPHCHANLLYDPNTATMYCPICKKYREGV